MTLFTRIRPEFHLGIRPSLLPMLTALLLLAETVILYRVAIEQSQLAVSFIQASFLATERRQIIEQLAEQNEALRAALLRASGEPFKLTP